MRCYFNKAKNKIKKYRAICPAYKRSVLPSAVLALVALIAITFIFTGCHLSLVRTEEIRDKIGTYVSVVIYSRQEDAEKIIDKSFARLDEIAKIASTYDTESSVSVLNKNAEIKNAPADLVELIRLSLEYNIISHGAFDITVSPVLNLWSEGLWQETQEVQQEKVSEALEFVGSSMIELKGSDIMFKKEGIEVTLGGIAKGYIVDEMIKVMESMGVKNALVDAGGDIATMGSRPDGMKWNISLENPDNPRQRIATFAVEGEAVATSGNYYRYFDPEKQAHHLIDPRTGFSANECISVTIITGSATAADILATSVFVLGPKKGMELVESLSGVEALIIDLERNIIKSSGIDKYIK